MGNTQGSSLSSTLEEVTSSISKVGENITLFDSGNSFTNSMSEVTDKMGSTFTQLSDDAGNFFMSAVEEVKLATPDFGIEEKLDTVMSAMPSLSFLSNVGDTIASVGNETSTFVSDMVDNFSSSTVGESLKGVGSVVMETVGSFIEEENINTEPQIVELSQNEVNSSPNSSPSKDYRFSYTALDEIPDSYVYEMGNLSQDIDEKILPQYCHIYVLGDNGVGKSSIISVFLNQPFSDEYKPTLGANFENTASIVDNNPVTIKLCELTVKGETLYSYKLITECDALVLVYDQTKPETFLHTQIRYKDYQSKLSIPVIVIGNMNDKQSEISSDAVASWCSSYEIPFYSVSAKTNTNIERAFTHISQIAYHFELKRQNPALI